MKITKKQLDTVCSLPDETLKTLIKSLAGASGFDLSGFNATPGNLERIRSVLRGMNDADVSRAAEILKNNK